MVSTVSISESNILAALRSFLLGVLPTGTEVVRGEANRVAEPAGANFVVMTPILRSRLATNVDGVNDVAFTGSITGTTMTVTAMINGAISIGQTLYGTGITTGTAITAIGTGTGGTGTYTITPSQAVAGTTIQAGSSNATQATQVIVQIDVHGPISGDNVQAISTLLRDQYAVDQLAASGHDIAPLYASEPRQIPFVNGEQAVEIMWTVDAVLQANPAISTPQQFAGAVTVGIINVDAVYPP